MKTLKKYIEYISKSTDYVDFLIRINKLIEGGYTDKLIKSDRMKFHRFARPMKDKLKKEFEEAEPDSLVRNLILLQRVYGESVSDFCDEILNILNEKEKKINKRNQYIKKLKILMNE